MSTEDNAPTPDQFAGQPDAWQRLWTPHRMVYIGGKTNRATPPHSNAPSAGSPLVRTRTGSLCTGGPTCTPSLTSTPTTLDT